MSQEKRIMDYLQQHGSINPMQAMTELGIMRLGARIFDLKRRGVPIQTKIEQGINRFGEPCKYAVYILRDE